MNCDVVKVVTDHFIRSAIRMYKLAVMPNEMSVLPASRPARKTDQEEIFVLYNVSIKKIWRIYVDID